MKIYQTMCAYVRICGFCSEEGEGNVDEGRKGLTRNILKDGMWKRNKKDTCTRTVTNPRLSDMLLRQTPG